ncbi:MAG: hypothetical protein PGN29_12740 [Gordonia paraffinivorans]
MSRRQRIILIAAAAVAPTLGIASPAVSASPLSDLITSIGTGSAGPRAQEKNETQLQIRSGIPEDFRGYLVRRGPSDSDTCFTITDSSSGSRVTDGFRVPPNYVSNWTVTVDTTTPGCERPATAVSFSGGRNGTPAVTIIGGARGFDVRCSDRSRAEGSCDIRDHPSGGFAVTIS